MNEKLLTIGIPAYNRRQALGNVLNDMLGNGLGELPDVEILVIDDDSADGTFEAIRPLNGVGNLRILKNEQRAGFAGNFGRLIENCSSEYLLYSCDDDFVLKEGVLALLDYLKAESSPPALISSLFYDDGAVYRGNPNEVRDIGLHEYRDCCNHLPGIVINARLAKAVWSRLARHLLDRRNAYPQCCLALVFLLFGYRCIYLPVELVRTGYALESGITGYATVGERWKQFLFFCEFLTDLQSRIDDARIGAIVRELLESHKLSLFRTLGNGVSNEQPELARYYLQGALDHFKTT